MIEAKPLNIQDEINKMTESKVLLDRCFFAKNTALKIQLTKKITESECYIHLGAIDNASKWNWVKTKFNDIELAQIINFINNKEKSISFFHKFKDSGQSIHINKVDKSDTEKGISIKIKNISKYLSEGELKILEILLTKVIELKNFN